MFLSWLKKRRSRFTKEEALKIARRFGLERDVRMAMSNGLSPDEALLDWDIYPDTDKQLEEWLK